MLEAITCGTWEVPQSQGKNHCFVSDKHIQTKAGIEAEAESPVGQADHLGARPAGGNALGPVVTVQERRKAAGRAARHHHVGSICRYEKK